MAVCQWRTSLEIQGKLRTFEVELVAVACEKFGAFGGNGGNCQDVTGQQAKEDEQQHCTVSSCGEFGLVGGQTSVRQLRWEKMVSERVEARSVRSCSEGREWSLEETFGCS